MILTQRRKSFKSLLPGKICFLLMEILIACETIVHSASPPTCYSIPNTTSTGIVYVRQGAPLSILCSSVNNDSKNLTIECDKSSKLLKNIIRNGSTLIHEYINPDIGNWHCYCSNTKTNLSCSINAFLEAPLKNVSDFNCFSDNLESLDCSWTSPMNYSNYSHVKFNLSMYNMQKMLTPCKIQDDIQGRWHFKVNHGNKACPFRKDFPNTVIRLKSYTELYSNDEDININHYPIVKLKPPIINVTQIKPHSAVLQWNTARDIVQYLKCGLEHEIEYTDCSNNTVLLNTTWLPFMAETYSFNLTALKYAHMKYNVSVKSRPRAATGENSWAISTISFTTASEIPQRPPEVPAGAFINNLYKTKTIYWKQLKYYEECGDNFTYRIHVSQSQIDINHSCYNHTIYKSTGALELTFQSVNAIGSSINHSKLYIPAESELLEGPSVFHVRAHTNGTYELFWQVDQPQEVDNYTLFWCKSFALECADSIDYITLNPNETSYMCTPPTLNYYKFYISVNSGHKTSGMVSSKCDLTTEAANYGQVLKFVNDPPKDTSVRVNFTMNCNLKDEVVGFNLTYCSILDHSSNAECVPHTTMVIYINNPNETTYEATKLAYGYYKFNIVILTAKGSISSKQWSLVVPISELHLLKTVINYVAFIVLMIVCLIGVFRWCKRRKRRDDIHVALESEYLCSLLNGNQCEDVGRAKKNALVSNTTAYAPELTDKTEDKQPISEQSEPRTNNNQKDTSDLIAPSCAPSTPISGNLAKISSGKIIESRGDILFTINDVTPSSQVPSRDAPYSLPNEHNPFKEQTSATKISEEIRRSLNVNADSSHGDPILSTNSSAGSLVYKSPVEAEECSANDESETKDLFVDNELYCKMSPVRPAMKPTLSDHDQLALMDESDHYARYGNLR